MSHYEPSDIKHAITLSERLKLCVKGTHCFYRDKRYTDPQVMYRRKEVSWFGLFEREVVHYEWDYNEILVCKYCKKEFDYVIKEIKK